VLLDTPAQQPLTAVAAELGITQPRASQLLKSARAKIAAEIGLDF